MLEIKNLYKTFNAGTINEKQALKNINLTLNNGDFVSVIGGNGAGKSTLLNAIAGSFKIDDGSIFLDGTDITNMLEHERAKFLGRVFQDPMRGTAGNMQIEENLALANRRGQKRTLKWQLKQEERNFFKEQLHQLNLGLEDRLETKVGLLSGGQRQALTLLMATMKKPQLLLLDEHTAALDPKTAKIVLDLTVNLVEKNQLTTFMVTHNMKDALRYGNRLIMMNEGEIILDVSGEDKKKLTVNDLLDLFNQTGELNDSMILG